jgi:hypothetical protein
MAAEKEPGVAGRQRMPLRLHFPTGGDPHRRAWMYTLGWGLSRLIFSTYFRGRSEGWEHVPEVGPFIVASNHTSFAIRRWSGRAFRARSATRARIAL